MWQRDGMMYDEVLELRSEASGRGDLVRLADEVLILKRADGRPVIDLKHPRC